MQRDTGNGMQVPSLAPYEGKDWPAPEKGFAAMITRLDRDVGRIVDQLKASGQDRNTLVLFASDNGPRREGGHSPDFFGSRGPLRGIKRDLYEGGIRVPFLAWWPGRVKPGTTTDESIAFWDVLPTLCELAGTAPPSGLDGRSFASLLQGGAGPRHEYLYWEFHEGGFKQAIRQGDWKAVRIGRHSPLELYNLRTDLSEATNVAAANPTVVEQMERLFRGARTSSAVWPLKD